MWDHIIFPTNTNIKIYQEGPKEFSTTIFLYKLTTMSFFLLVMIQNEITRSIEGEV